MSSSDEHEKLHSSQETQQTPEKSRRQALKPSYLTRQKVYDSSSSSDLDVFATKCTKAGYLTKQKECDSRSSSETMQDIRTPTKYSSKTKRRLIVQ
jgi:hypothetical protein